MMATIHEDRGGKKKNQPGEVANIDYKKEYSKAKHTIKKLRADLAAAQATNASSEKTTNTAETQTGVTRNAQTEEDDVKVKLQQELDTKCQEVAILKQQLKRMVENIQSFTSSIVLDVDTTTTSTISPLSPAPTPLSPTPTLVAHTPVSPNCGNQNGSFSMAASSVCVNLSQNFETLNASLSRCEAKNIARPGAYEPVGEQFLSEDNLKDRSLLQEIVSCSYTVRTVSDTEKESAQSKATDSIVKKSSDPKHVLNSVDTKNHQMNSNMKLTGTKDLSTQVYKSQDDSEMCYDQSETPVETTVDGNHFQKHSLLEIDESDSIGFSPHFSSTESESLEVRLQKQQHKGNLLTSCTEMDTSECKKSDSENKDKLSKATVQSIFDTQTDNFQDRSMSKSDVESVNKNVSNDLKSNSEMVRMKRHENEKISKSQDIPENAPEICDSKNEESKKDSIDLDTTNNLTDIKTNSHNKKDSARSNKSSDSKSSKESKHTVSSDMSDNDSKEPINIRPDTNKEDKEFCDRTFSTEICEKNDGRTVNDMQSDVEQSKIGDNSKVSSGSQEKIHNENYNTKEISAFKSQDTNVNFISSSEQFCSKTNASMPAENSIKAPITDSGKPECVPVITHGSQICGTKGNIAIEKELSHYKPVAENITSKTLSNKMDIERQTLKRSFLSGENENLADTPKTDESSTGKRGKRKRSAEGGNGKEIKTKKSRKDSECNQNDTDTKTKTGDIKVNREKTRQRKEHKTETEDFSEEHTTQKSEESSKEKTVNTVDTTRRKSEIIAVARSELAKHEKEIDEISHVNSEQTNPICDKDENAKKVDRTRIVSSDELHSNRSKESETKSMIFYQLRKERAFSKTSENDTVKLHSKETEKVEKVDQVNTEVSEEKQHFELVRSLKDYCTKFRKKTIHRNEAGYGPRNPYFEPTVVDAVKHYTTIAKNACTRSRISLREYRQKRNCMLKEKENGVYMRTLEDTMAKSACLSTVVDNDNCADMTDFEFSSKESNFAVNKCKDITDPFSSDDTRKYMSMEFQPDGENHKEMIVNEKQKTRLDFSAIEAGLSCFASKIAGSSVVVPKRIERIQRARSPAMDVPTNEASSKTVSKHISLVKDLPEKMSIEANSEGKAVGTQGPKINIITKRTKMDTSPTSQEGCEERETNGNQHKGVDKTLNKLDTLQWASDKTANYLSDLYSMATKEDESAVNLVVSNTINVLTDVHKELSKSSPQKIRPPTRSPLPSAGASLKPALFEPQSPNSKTMVHGTTSLNVTKSPDKSLLEGARRNSLADAEFDVNKFAVKFGQPFTIPKKLVSEFSPHLTNVPPTLTRGKSDPEFARKKLDPSFKIPKKPVRDALLFDNAPRSETIQIPLERNPGIILDDPRLGRPPMHQPEVKQLAISKEQSVAAIQSRDPRTRHRLQATEKSKYEQSTKANMPCASPQQAMQQNQELNVVLDLIRSSEMKNEPEDTQRIMEDPPALFNQPPESPSVSEGTSVVPANESNIQELAMMMQMLTDPKFYPDSPFINHGPSPELAHRAMCMLSHGIRPDLMQLHVSTNQDTAGATALPENISAILFKNNETAADKTETRASAKSVSPKGGAVQKTPTSVRASPHKNTSVQVQRCLKREVKDPSSYKSSRVHTDISLPVDALPSDTQDSTLWNMAMSENDVANEIRSPTSNNMGSRRSSLGIHDESFSYDDISQASFNGPNNMPQFVNFIENLDFSSFFGKSKESETSFGEERVDPEQDAFDANEGSKATNCNYTSEESNELNESGYGLRIATDDETGKDGQADENLAIFTQKINKSANTALSGDGASSVAMETKLVNTHAVEDPATQEKDVLNIIYENQESISKEQEKSTSSRHFQSEQNIDSSENQPEIVTGAKEDSVRKENDVVKDEKLDEKLPTVSQEIAKSADDQHVINRNPENMETEVNACSKDDSDLSGNNSSKEESICDLQKDLLVSDDEESSYNITPSVSNTNSSEYTRANKAPTAVSTPKFGRDLSKIMGLGASNSEDSLVIHPSASENMTPMTYDEQHSNFLVCFSASISNQLSGSDEYEGKNQSSVNLSSSMEGSVDNTKTQRVNEKSFDNSNSRNTSYESESFGCKTALNNDGIDRAWHDNQEVRYEKLETTPGNVADKVKRKCFSLERKPRVWDEESDQVNDVTDKHMTSPIDNREDCASRDSLKFSPLKRFKSRLSPKVLQSVMYSPVRQVEDGGEVRLPADEAKADDEESYSEASGSDDEGEETVPVDEDTPTTSTPTASAADLNVQNQTSEHEIDSISLLPAGEDTFDCHDVSNPFSPESKQRTKSVSPVPTKSPPKPDKRLRDARTIDSSSKDTKHSSNESSDSRRRSERDASRRGRKGSPDHETRDQKTTKRLELRSSPRKRVNTVDSPRSRTRELAKRSDSTLSATHDRSCDRADRSTRSTRDRRYRDNRDITSDSSRSRDTVRKSTRTTLESKCGSRKSRGIDPKNVTKDSKSCRRRRSENKRNDKHSKDSTNTKDCRINSDNKSRKSCPNDSDIDSNIDFSEFIEVDTVEGSGDEEPNTDLSSEIEENKEEDGSFEAENEVEGNENLEQKQESESSFEEAEKADNGNNEGESQDKLREEHKCENTAMVCQEALTGKKKEKEGLEDEVTEEKSDKVDDRGSEKKDTEGDGSKGDSLEINGEEAELIDVEISLEEGELSDSVEDDTQDSLPQNIGEESKEKQSEGNQDGGKSKKAGGKDNPKKQGKKMLDLREKIISKRGTRVSKDRHDTRDQTSRRERRSARSSDHTHDRSPRQDHVPDRSPRYSDQRSSNSRERMSPRRGSRDTRKEVRSPQRRGDDLSRRDRDRNLDSTNDLRRDKRSPNRRPVDPRNRKARSVSRERQNRIGPDRPNRERNRRSSSRERRNRYSPDGSDRERNARSVSRERRAKTDARTSKPSRSDSKTDTDSRTPNRKPRVDSRLDTDCGSSKQTRSRRRLNSDKDVEKSKSTPSKETKTRLKRKRSPSFDTAKPRKGKR